MGKEGRGGGRPTHHPPLPYPPSSTPRQHKGDIFPASLFLFLDPHQGNFQEPKRGGEAGGALPWYAQPLRRARSGRSQGLAFPGRRRMAPLEQRGSSPPLPLVRRRYKGGRRREGSEGRRTRSSISDDLITPAPVCSLASSPPPLPHVTFLFLCSLLLFPYSFPSSPLSPPSSSSFRLSSPLPLPFFTLILLYSVFPFPLPSPCLLFPLPS